MIEEPRVRRLPLNNTTPDMQALFCGAIEQESPKALEAYLDSACAGDAELRANLQGLIDSHREAGNFLGDSASILAETVVLSGIEKPGTQIGPYKLLE